MGEIKYGQWYKFGREILSKANNDQMERTLLKFDNGAIRRYEEDYPFAEIVAILFYPKD